LRVRLIVPERISNTERPRGDGNPRRRWTNGAVVGAASGRGRHQGFDLNNLWQEGGADNKRRNPCFQYLICIEQGRVRIRTGSEACVVSAVHYPRTRKDANVSN